MATKKVEAVIPPATPHFVGDGFRVHNFIPSQPRLSMQRMDPFIMLDYNSRFYFPPTDKPRGVSVHPHRGFETVTIAYKGSVAHHDSGGGGGVIAEGDVQWMTAASGVLHKEYHEETFSKAGGDFHMVQLWVNLPAKDKMSQPKYQSIGRDSIPKVALAGGAGSVEVIAGEYRSTPGGADTFSPLHLYNVRLQQQGEATFSFPPDYNTALLVIEGGVRVNGSVVAPTDHLVLFGNEGEDLIIEATTDALLLMMSGEPLNEPIAAHGPFVMNTRDEISQAFHDFQAGKFGVLE